MTQYKTLISGETLFQNLSHPDWVMVDCRFSLADTGLGRRQYLQAHIPGGVYAHLDDDLSGPVIPGTTGRHPLPSIEAFTQTLSQWGIDYQTQVIAYDDSGGAIAARLWWMLRWLGHEAAAVLDGGWRHWQRAGFPVKSGLETRAKQPFRPAPRPELSIDTQRVLAMRISPDALLIDSRDPQRYRGELETIDIQAGHIPGALNAPYTENLDAVGRFHEKDILRSHFEGLLEDQPAEQVVFYCGSGVTAAHNILALAHAGLGEARLYPGSWSERIADPERPITK